MATEKRLIDADAFCMYLADVQLANRGWKDELCGFLDDVMEALDDAPTVEAVEVVRCNDCTSYCSFEISKMYGKMQYCSLTGLPTDPCDFCSYGERRKEKC